MKIHNSYNFNYSSVRSSNSSCIFYFRKQKEVGIFVKQLNRESNETIFTQ